MSAPVPSFKDCIQIAACQSHQLLPMQPDLPADIFTACLTTPIKIALNWFCQQNSGKLVEGINIDLIEK
jgi:regulator-associated protein of mTOR